jgi:hypothetical protein
MRSPWAPKVGLQITTRETTTLQVVREGFDGVWCRKAIVLCFVGFYERGEHVEAVSHRCIGRGVKQAFDFRKGSLIISFRSNGADLHRAILSNRGGVDLIVVLV